MSASPSDSQRHQPKDSAILSGKAICILGRSSVHNEALASCLERETGAQCVLVEDTGNILTTDYPQPATLPTLMLWDCREKTPKSLLEELRLCALQKPSGCKVLLLNVRRIWGIERQLVQSSISGFFYREDPLRMVLNGIRAVLDGELWFPRKAMTDCILEGRERAGALGRQSGALTPRQVEIVALVAVGATNDEIADRLRISPHTVKTHLYQLFKKINVPNRMQAALWAAKNL
jgi:LuxR family transcriptional regulator, positive regulator of biofilm formation